MSESGRVLLGNHPQAVAQLLRTVVVFHTYSSYARGSEKLIGTLMILDRAPKGRNEDSTMDFVRRHDEYPRAEPRA